MSNKFRIEQLENRNAEIAKEILLSESAIHEAELEMEKIDPDFISHPVMQQHLSNLKSLIGRLNDKNRAYKLEIYQNDLEIIKLRKEDESGKID